jgi:signal peptidase I
VVPTLVLLGLALAAAGWARHGWRTVVVSGNSMSPTYHDGDRLLVRRGTARLRPGDAVVFRTPKVADRVSDDVDWLVKRIVAGSGDLVPAEMAAVVPDMRVRASHVLVRGDNPQSLDSRHFGYVPVADILGAVIRPIA